MKLATQNIQNWIFVTGTIRSGTTFVGQILSLPKEVDYIHEPFNPQCGIPGLHSWYPYLRPEPDTPHMQLYHEKAKSIFRYDFQLRNHIPSQDAWIRKQIKRLIGSRGPYYLRLAKLNLFHTTAVIKDPIGNLMTEYLYHQFQVKPVILVKHPTSFIASLKRVNWWPGVQDITEYPEFAKDFLPEPPSLALKNEQSPIKQAAFYWKSIYSVLLQQSRKYPDWQIITHENLSHDPIGIFKKIYGKLELPWSPGVEQKILQKTQGNDGAKPRIGTVQNFNRNSADIFKVSRDSLSLEERRLIYEIVHEVSSKIYSKESFALDM